MRLSGMFVACVALAVSQTTHSDAAAANSKPSPDDAYLNSFRGDWEMVGDVRGTPVRYHCHAERVLGDGFLLLHLADAAPSPSYEADVFMGYDAAAHDYVVHWLDKFGAAGARVVATGRLEGEQLVVIFPYSTGAFRDTFGGDPGSGHWTLLIESQEKTGSWSTFGSYQVSRR
jgi:hypothetical protein